MFGLMMPYKLYVVFPSDFFMSLIGVHSVYLYGGRPKFSARQKYSAFQFRRDLKVLKIKNITFFAFFSNAWVFRVDF